MVRAGIIGLGRMGMSHSATVNSLKNAMVVSVCDSSIFVKGVVKKYTAFNFYTDYKKMIQSEELDCVIITTPTRFHFEMVKYALNAGLHVFVEKPLCLSSEESAELVELAKQKSTVCQVGYHNRFIKTFKEANLIMESGALGEILHVSGEAYGPVVLKEKKSTWRADSSKGGGCLYDYATHVVNLIQFLVGPPDKVSGVVLPKFYSNSAEDAVYATLLFDKSFSGTLSVNWSEYTYRKMFTQITILGKNGKIIVNSLQLQVYFVNDPGIEGYVKGWNIRFITDLFTDVSYYLRGEEYTAEFEYFINSIETSTINNLNSFDESQITDKIISNIRTSEIKG